MLFLWIIYVISVLFLICFRARLFINALWSPAGKELTSWPSFVMSQIVKLSLSHWYPGSDVVLDCIDSWSLPSFLLYRKPYFPCNSQIVHSAWNGQSKSLFMPPKELWEAYSNRTVRPSVSPSVSPSVRPSRFRVRSISPIFFEVGIPNLVCGYVLGWRSVAYHFRVTVTLTLTSDLVFRIIVSGAYLLYYLR